MILSDKRILEEIEAGNIIIEPFKSDCLGTNSYDVHLGKHLAAIVLTCGLSAGLVGCGFHLKGTNPSSAPVAYSVMSLSLPPNTEELQEKLRRHYGPEV